ncbi:SusE domain-containing protein [Maribacter polysiphoniae]|uniref:SusE domain-containing protein n=1 Tax=Maribacter polysiphoniae TaxID=429344 RepID=A0A316E8S1_9FLAO|nr:SusE domain-containing protein [Maribacter polysiphoniae]MBD1260467.1 SusE domain-containing protein [Maribacter polysiphoniae]PWK25932.1 uncharacterized protein DUF5019 [Maribacter polysiphoniae]
MKTIIKNFFKILPFILGAWLISSCENDDVVPEFTLSQASENVAFSFSAADEYLISTGTMDNVAERFVWNNVDFGVQTEINYQLQGSIDNTFAAYDPTTEYDSGTLSVTNAEVKVSDLSNLATLLGLEAGDSGQVYFRARAFAGSGEGADAVDSYSDVMTLNISILEESSGSTGVEISTWGVVGSGYNDWGGAGPDAPFYTTTTPGVIVSYATLIDGEIKFRENNDWASDLGEGDTDGTLAAGGANIAVTAGDYKITLNLNDSTYTIEAYSWGVVGSGYNDWGATPDAKFYYDYTTDTFTVGVRLVEGEIKFRMNNEWNVDFGDNGADGTLESGGENIAVSEGHYTIRMNLNDNTYTIEAADLWGVVGSGYNDWGATPDFTFTEVNPGIWIAEIVPLLDGEIKFRINNAWDTDFGDDGADGTLDAGGENIPSTAGNYRIRLDITNGTYSIN